MKIVKWFITLCVVTNTTFAFANIFVITSAKSPLQALNSEQVSALFLGKISSLPGVDVIQLIDQSEAAPPRAVFYQVVTGKTLTQVKNGWMRLVFSGKGAPPIEVSDDASVISKVAANQNLIGYIDEQKLNADVKVLYVVETNSGQIKR